MKYSLVLFLMATAAPGFYGLYVPRLVVYTEKQDRHMTGFIVLTALLLFIGVMLIMYTGQSGYIEALAGYGRD